MDPQLALRASHLLVHLFQDIADRVLSGRLNGRRLKRGAWKLERAMFFVRHSALTKENHRTSPSKKKTTHNEEFTYQRSEDVRNADPVSCEKPVVWYIERRPLPAEVDEDVNQNGEKNRNSPRKSGGSRCHAQPHLAKDQSMMHQVSGRMFMDRSNH